ncbi:MAG: hypothetical protein GWM89_08030 [Candidatus Dadabacteria bacterium]|nr:hypothetical protein [Candidatus Dadabacteria bacterium]NIY22359.1 hypothetical protein [Candidatus Dadabacteria bacterium]
MKIQISILIALNIILITDSFSQVRRQNDINLDLTTIYEHGFDTDIDDGGEVSVNRYSVRGTASTNFSKSYGLDINTSYSFTDFDFSGSSGFAGLNPWEGINQARLGFRLKYIINPEWGISSGPFIKYAGEQGADFSDSLTYGGLAGFTYSPSRNFFLGTGVYISSRLEDDVIAYPGLIMNWMVSERLRLSTLLTGVRSELGPRVQINYKVTEKIDTAISTGYEFQRFRLDGDGTAPDGIGEVKVLPVWASIGYGVSDYLRLELYSGLGFIGELELEDSNGSRIDKEDFDTMVFVGLGVKINNI